MLLSTQTAVPFNTLSTGEVKRKRLEVDLHSDTTADNPRDPGLRRKIAELPAQ
jgi:hypothetical protein